MWIALATRRGCTPTLADSCPKSAGINSSPPTRVEQAVMKMGGPFGACPLKNFLFKMVYCLKKFENLGCKMRNMLYFVNLKPSELNDMIFLSLSKPSMLQIYLSYCLAYALNGLGNCCCLFPIGSIFFLFSAIKDDVTDIIHRLCSYQQTFLFTVDCC